MPSVRRGVSCTDFDIDDLIDTVDRKLFSHITDPITVYTILPPRAHRSYNLRKRQHGYQLPQTDSYLVTSPSHLIVVCIEHSSVIVYSSRTVRTGYLHVYSFRACVLYCIFLYVIVTLY